MNNRKFNCGDRITAPDGKTKIVIAADEKNIMCIWTEDFLIKEQNYSLEEAEHFPRSISPNKETDEVRLNELDYKNSRKSS